MIFGSIPPSSTRMGEKVEANTQGFRVEYWAMNWSVHHDPLLSFAYVAYGPLWRSSDTYILDEARHSWISTWA